MKKHLLSIENRVRDFIRRKALFSYSAPCSSQNEAQPIPTDPLLLVALSGGADSVCLLRLLLRLDYRVMAAHCNFHLRGAESDRDEAFVRDLCRSLGVPLQVASFDTRGEAAAHGESIEMAARRLRYEWFDRLRRECGAQAIAVAHHREDSAETLLLNLLRGTGISGLCGIRPRNGHIVRPLLCLDRSDIERYLKALSQPYVDDSTNFQTDCRRNVVRLRLLPLMEELNPSVRETLATTAERLAQAEAVYRAAMAEAIPCAFDGRRIAFEALYRFSAPEALFHEILAPYGFTPEQEESLLRTDRVGVRVYAPRWELLRDRDAFLLYPCREADQPAAIEIDWRTSGRISLESFGFPYRMEWELLPYTTGYSIPRTPDTACFDADRIEQTFLTLRLPRKGDRFMPFGMKGSKLLSDFLTDLKLPRMEKENRPLLCDGDRIAWVVGLRSAQPYRITAATTRLLRLQLFPL